MTVNEEVPQEQGAPVALLQASCSSDLLLSLCDEHGIDRSGVIDRHALDGDPYVLALAVAATSQALRAICSVVKALLEDRHPVKLSVSVVDGDGKTTEAYVSGISVADLPAFEKAIHAARARAEEDADGGSERPSR